MYVVCMFLQIMDNDLGQITSIEIGHDNSGFFPGWFLNYVSTLLLYVIYVNTPNCL